MRALSGPTIFFALCGGLCLGCSHFDRISQCQELVSTVNDRIEAMEALAKSGETPQKYEKLSQSYTALAISVSKLPIAQSNGGTTTREYVELMRSTAQACADAANALRSGARADGAYKELERLARREKIFTAKLDMYCQSA
jgi:hypothetical protein